VGVRYDVLNMANPLVERKLRVEILPYLASARRLHGQWFCRVNVLFGYTTDFLVALTTLGVASPLLALLAGGQASSGAKETPKTSLAEALASVPAKLHYPILALVIAWIVLRIAFNREDGQKRAVLAKSCATTLRLADAQLHQILPKPDPMPELFNQARL